MGRVRQWTAIILSRNYTRKGNNNNLSARRIQKQEEAATRNRFGWLSSEAGNGLCSHIT